MDREKISKVVWYYNVQCGKISSETMTHIQTVNFTKSKIFDTLYQKVTAILELSEHFLMYMYMWKKAEKPEMRSIAHQVFPKT